MWCWKCLYMRVYFRHWKKVLLTSRETRNQRLWWGAFVCEQRNIRSPSTDPTSLSLSVCLCLSVCLSMSHCTCGPCRSVSRSHLKSPLLLLMESWQVFFNYICFSVSNKGRVAFSISLHARSAPSRIFCPLFVFITLFPSQNAIPYRRAVVRERWRWRALKMRLLNDTEAV